MLANAQLHISNREYAALPWDGAEGCYDQAGRLKRALTTAGNCQTDLNFLKLNTSEEAPTWPSFAAFHVPVGPHP